MVKEFQNITDDSSEYGFGQCEGVGPSNAPYRDDSSDSSDNGNDEEDPEEGPEEESDETKTQEKGVVHEGQIAQKAENQVKNA